MKKIFIKIMFFLSLICLVTACGDSDEAAFQSNSDVGVGGSYARFMIVNDFMYIIDNTNLKIFSLANASSPDLVGDQVLGFGVESIYNLDNRLFIGSSEGLYIYTIQENGIPTQASFTSYTSDFPFLPCDPVVANDSIAFVTLNSTRVTEFCGSFQSFGINELRVFEVTDIENPTLINVLGFSSPKGLGLDDNILFICDDQNGLFVLDVSDPRNIQILEHKEGFQTYDVIPLNGLLLVVGPDNVYQFDYTDINNIEQISSIPILP